MIINTKQLEEIMLERLLTAGNMTEVINNTRWQKYINTSLTTLGIATATQRQIAKLGYQPLQDLTMENKIEILGKIFQETKLFEIKNQCLYFLDQHKQKKIEIAHWPFIKEWIKHVDNWAHSDGLSSVYTVVLQHHLDIIYPQLKTWNKSKNLWERRQSVVCIFYYSRTRKNFLSFDDSIALIENLLDDKEYYVQKGIGWALREASNVYYDYTLDFLMQNIKEIKPAAYGAAIEKLKPNHLAQVKHLRKKKSTF
jgi:3-methyladenine DNA glycosylase AlkD